MFDVLTELLSDTVVLQELAAVLLIFVMLGSGLAMIAIGSRERTKRLSKRVERVQAASGASKTGSAQRKPETRIIPQSLQGLTEFEYRQVVRVYTRFGVAPEAAFNYFTGTRLAMMALLAGGAVPLAWKLFAKSLAFGLMPTAAAAIVGWFIPLMLIRRSITRRRNAIGNGLPDALELLAVCVEAGLSLENGLQRVAHELRRSQPALADELHQTWAEINILPNRDQALINLADRVNIPSIRSVVNTLSQTLRYGTPLARSLRVVAGDVRNDQLTQMEEKANRLPAMMTVPVMVFIMPTIFMIVGGPAALKLMDMFGH